MIDIVTLVFVVVFILLIVAVGLLIIQMRTKNSFHGLDLWSYGLILICGSTFLVIEPNMRSNYLLNIINSFLLMCGSLMLVISMHRFMGIKAFYYDCYALIISATVLLLFLHTHVRYLHLFLTTGFLIYSFTRLTIIFGLSKKTVFKQAFTTPFILSLLMIVSLIGRFVSPWVFQAGLNYQGMNILNNLMVGLFMILLTTLSITLTFIVNWLSMKKLFHEEERFQQIFEQSPYAILIFDIKKQQAISINDTFTALTGYTLEMLQQKDFLPHMIFEPMQNNIPLDDLCFCHLQSDIEVIIKHANKDQQMTYGLLSTSIIENNNEHLAISSISNTSEIIKLKERLKSIAHTDMLTNLPNRRSLLIHVDQLMKENSPFSVLTIDIDDFKLVNDKYGHDAGDYFLRVYSNRLDKVADKQRFIARFGGDEFVVILKNIDDQETAKQHIQFIFDALKPPISYLEEQFVLTVSIGVSFYPQDGNYFDDLLKKADSALYHVKKTSKNNFDFFRSEKLSNMKTRTS